VVKKRKVELRDNPACDRGLVVTVAGVNVAAASYDQHGWVGIEAAAEKTAASIAEAFGIAVDDRRSR
jgi:hypothetical protein